ncbi:hypothetical protein L7F22_022829 [Adiantum nelumboides]|nr:hypothetical protein [Adiantum nelumboides]
MAERQEEFAIMMKQIQELQAALAHPEVQQVLKTLEKGKARVEDAAPTVTLPASQAVKKLQRDVGVGTSKVHEASAHDEDSIPSPTYSPNYSFMNNLEDLGPDFQVPHEDSTEDSSRDARAKDTNSSEKKIPVHPDSQKIKKKSKHHKKKRTFKSGDKDVKFEYYNGKRVISKALTFVRQFEVAFAEGNFSEHSKLRHVGMHLKETASSWWLTTILEGRKPKSWEDFKKAFYGQFLPPDFEKEVKKEWDRLSQDENESVSAYVDKYWEILLKVTPFKKISDEEKMRKFETGLHTTLQKSLCLYPHDTLQIMIESAIIAEGLHPKNIPL